MMDESEPVQTEKSFRLGDDSPIFAFFCDLVLVLNGMMLYQPMMTNQIGYRGKERAMTGESLIGNQHRTKPG